MTFLLHWALIFTTVSKTKSVVLCTLGELSEPAEPALDAVTEPESPCVPEQPVSAPAQETRAPPARAINVRRSMVWEVWIMVSFLVGGVTDEPAPARLGVDGVPGRGCACPT